MNICLYGASSPEIDPVYLDAAYAFGRLLAQHGPGQRAVDAAGQSAQIIHAAGLGRLDGCAAERVIRQGLVQAYEFV